MSASSDAARDLPEHVFDTEPDSFASDTVPPHTADDATRDYVRSNLAAPRDALASAAARSAFVLALLGDTALAKDAEDDVPLLRQLEARVAILVHHVAALIPDAPLFDTDVLIALLALVAARWPVLLDAMERDGVTLIVVRTMRRCRHRPTVVARCMTALRAFTVTDPMRKRVMIDGGMDITLELMSIHQNDRRVQDRAAAVIANVAFGCPHRKRRIARQGALKKIIDGMAAFPLDENIQLRGALTIRNLTHEAQVNQYIAGNQGAVEAIAATLLRFRGSSTNPELRFQCVMALESLCREDERNRQRVVDIDNTATLIPKNLSSSSDAPSKRSDDTEERVNEDGDVVVEEEQVLVTDMSTNFRHGAALCPGRSSTSLIASPSVSSSAGSERVPHVSPSHDNPPGTCENPETEKESANTPGAASEKKPSLIRAVVHAMRRDPDDVLLLETGLSLLTLIALARPETQNRIGELGGIQVAIAAIRRHSKSGAIARRACALVRCLCLQEANRSRVTSGLPVLISSANVHCKDPDVVREVASALSNAVFEHEKNRVWVVNKGGVAAAVRAMDECGAKDVMVLEAGICTLRNFVDASYNCALAAANEGAVRAAVAALDRTKDASSTGQQIVQEQAVLFLVDVARLAPQTQAEMREIDAADWIENALAKLSQEDYPQLHTAGDKLINILTKDDGSKFGSHKTQSHGTTPPSPTTISDRAHPRGLFSAFSLPRRKQSKGASQAKKKFVGRSMPIETETRRKSKRLSARLLKSSVLS